MKDFQRFLNLFIFEYLPINEKVVFSYRKTVNAKDAILPHTKNKYILSTDIKSFFASMNEDKLKDIFSKNIDNFDKVDIIGKVNLLSGSSINRGDINLNNGKLNIMLDTQKKDSKGKLIGHALYNHIGKITKDQKIVQVYNLERILLLEARNINVLSKITLIIAASSMSSISSVDSFLTKY